ncbi:hypothetical protein ACFSHQ_01395 [Gemmobacter lanyuensis]
MAINLFLLGLIGVAIGLPALPPVTALVWSLPLGLPATWAAARWVRHLIRQGGGCDPANGCQRGRRALVLGGRKGPTP